MTRTLIGPRTGKQHADREENHRPVSIPLNDQYESGDEGEDDSEVTVEVDSFIEDYDVEDDQNWVDVDDEDEEGESNEEGEDHEDEDEDDDQDHDNHDSLDFEKRAKPKLLPPTSLTNPEEEEEIIERNINTLQTLLFSGNPQMELQAIRNCRLLSCDLNNQSIILQQFTDHEDFIAFLSTLLLERTEFPDILIETTWFIVNLSSGTIPQIYVLTGTPLIERLIPLIHSTIPLVQLLSIWALANLMGSDRSVQDLLFDNNVLPIMITFINQLDFPTVFTENRQLLQILSFFLVNTTRASDEMDDGMVLNLLRTVVKFHALEDEDILTCTCWGLYYLLPNLPGRVADYFTPVTNALPFPPPPPPANDDDNESDSGNENENDNNNDNENNQINQQQQHFPQVLPRMIELLSFPSPRVLLPVLRFMGELLIDQGGSDNLFTHFHALHSLERMKELVTIRIPEVFPAESSSSSQGKDEKEEPLAAGETKEIERENNPEQKQSSSPLPSFRLTEEVLAGVLWVLSSMVYSAENIQPIFDAQFLPDIITLMATSSWKIKFEATAVLSSIITRGTPYQIMAIVEGGGLKPFIAFLHPFENESNAEVIDEILDSIQKLMTLADTFQNRDVLIGMFKSYGLPSILKVVMKQGNQRFVDSCESILKMFKEPKGSKSTPATTNSNQVNNEDEEDEIILEDEDAEDDLEDEES